jgi:ADP-heptose:LPS heptosyltransferase
MIEKISTVAGSNASLQSTAVMPAPLRILICRPNGRLGNALFMTPLVREIETTFPGAEVDILTAYPAASEIFCAFTNVRKLHQLPRLGVRHPLQMLTVFLRARQVVYDLIIDPCRKSRTARFWAWSMRGRHKVGFVSESWISGLIANISAEGAPHHMGHHPVHLFRQAVKRSQRDAMPSLDIHLTDAERQFGAEKVAQLCAAERGEGPLIGVFANATGAKRLSATWWESMLAVLTEGLPGARILEIVPAEGGARLRQQPGYFSTSLRRMAAVISATDYFVSADCGVMHLGVSTGTPTIGLFTVTDPALYEPYGAHNTSLFIGEDSPARVAERILQQVRSNVARACAPLPADAANPRINIPLVNRSPRLETQLVTRAVSADA